MAEVCAKLDLVHVDDPFRDEEFRELRERVERFAEDHETVYVLFNNDAMYENARWFQELLEE